MIIDNRPGGGVILPVAQAMAQPLLLMVRWPSGAHWRNLPHLSIPNIPSGERLSVRQIFTSIDV
jgi:hypothetical protein